MVSEQKERVYQMRTSEMRLGGIVLVLCVLSWATSGIASGPSAVKSALKQVQRPFPETYTLEVEIELPVALLLPGQGQTTQLMRVSVDKDVIAIVWKASQLPVPKYYPPGTGGYQGIDYDGDGNLIVSMWSEGATFCDQDIHEQYSESAGSRVAPNGVVVGQVSGAVFWRHSPSFFNTDNMSMLQAVWRTLGGPLGDDFGELEVQEVKADGTHELRVAGQASRYSGRGVWNLVIDPANGNFVRSGSFGPRDGPPRIRFRNEGTRRFANLTLAQRGEHIQGPLTTQVRLISFSPTRSDAIIEEARRIIARAQTRTVHLFDSRENSALPKHRLVPAGKLDDEE